MGREKLELEEGINRNGLLALLLNFMTNVTKIVDFDTLSFLFPDEKFQRDTALGKFTFARSAEEWG